MKKKILILVLIAIILCGIGYLVYDKFLNKEINTTPTNETSNINIEDLIEGTYHNDSENEYSYHSATLIAKNQTDSSIDFELSAIHGADKDNVNVGEVKGTAKKVGPNLYEFSDDGNAITFRFDIYKSFSRATVTESYKDDFNPYAGHNVHFSGKYIDTRIQTNNN